MWSITHRQVTAADVAQFQAIVGRGEERGSVVTEDLDAYNRDWTGKYRGAATVLLRPRTTHHVSDILRHCNARRLAVSTQGAFFLFFFRLVLFCCDHC